MRPSVVENYDVNFLYSDGSNSETDTGYTWSNAESVDSPGKIFKALLYAFGIVGISLVLWLNFRTVML